MGRSTGRFKNVHSRVSSFCRRSCGQAVRDGPRYGKAKPKFEGVSRRRFPPTRRKTTGENSSRRNNGASVIYPSRGVGGPTKKTDYRARQGFASRSQEAPTRRVRIGSGGAEGDKGGTVGLPPLEIPGQRGALNSPGPSMCVEFPHGPPPRSLLYVAAAPIVRHGLLFHRSLRGGCWMKRGCFFTLCWALGKGRYVMREPGWLFCVGNIPCCERRVSCSARGARMLSCSGGGDARWTGIPSSRDGRWKWLLCTTQPEVR